MHVLRELERKGVTVVLSTARPPRSVHPLASELGLTGPVIAYNGALAFDLATRRTLFHHPIPRPTALQVLCMVRALSTRINVGLELADEWHVDRMDDHLRAYLAAGYEPPTMGDVEHAITATNRGVSKIYFVASPEVRALAEERFAKAGLNITVTSSGAGMVEIIAPGTNKGAALHGLARVLGIPTEQTLAVGDEENDIPALVTAGLGIAMGNAAPSVKAAARAVTASNAEDGWARAMEEYVLRDSG